MSIKNTVANKMLAGLLLVLLASCGHADRVSPERYMQYAGQADNGCTVSRTFGEILFTARYEPLAYKVIRDLKAIDSTVTEANYNNLANTEKDQVYFIFRMESVGRDASPLKILASGPASAARVMQYTQSRLQGDFHLESGNREIPCALYHLEDDYSMLNYSLISLSFDASRIDASADMTLVYNDQLFENGPIKFTIRRDALNAFPHLKFQ
jgi:hypothetical protein